MGDDSPIVRHLRAGQDQRARIDEAVSAFRRLAPSDYGHFLATIEGDLGGDMAELSSGGVRGAPLLLAAPAKEPPSGSLREAVLGLLSDGQARSTMEIRRELEEHRPVNRGTLHTEIFTLRKMGLLRSEGNGRGRRHTRASAAGGTRSGSAGKREPATRAPRRNKRDDDEDHPGRGRTAAPDAARTNSTRIMRDEDHSDSRTRSAPPEAARTNSTRITRDEDHSDSRTRTAPPDAAQIYASAISGHHLLTRAEELELSRRLEEVEIALWARLMDGPLAPEAQKLLLGLDSPVAAKDAGEARAADLDRLIATRVIESADPKDKRLVPELAALRTIAAEADRIRERFTICNLRLVPSTIRRHGYHLKTNLAMSDLIQEGNLGLLKAISRYDYRRGLRFSTFATWWIRHYLVRARQNSGEVRVPVHLHDLSSKVRRAKVELRKKLGRDPDRRELASAIKVPSRASRRWKATGSSTARRFPRLTRSAARRERLPATSPAKTPSPTRSCRRVRKATSSRRCSFVYRRCSSRSCRGASGSAVPNPRR